MKGKTNYMRALFVGLAIGSVVHDEGRRQLNPIAERLQYQRLMTRGEIHQHIQCMPHIGGKE